LTVSFATNAAFVGALLPNSRTAITAINRGIKSAQTITPCSTTTNARLHSAVALAVDRGVLYFYGFDVVGRPAHRLQFYGAPGKRIAALTMSYKPPAHGVLRDRAAIGWFYLVGLLEPIVRGFRPLTDIDVSGLPRRLTSRSTNDWLSALTPIDVAAEISELLRAVRDSRLPGVVQPNPEFGALGSVIGSDGDWIAGDTLVELKCTVGGVHRNHVAQLLCYYAFDELCIATAVPRHFSSLALCLPRQRCTIVGAVDDWLAAFGGPARSDLPMFVHEWCTGRRLP
jgi:hypothetical protein